MALAKDHQTPSCSFFRNVLQPSSSLEFPHIFPFGFDGYNNETQDHNNGLESPSNNNKMNQVVMSSSPPLSSSSSANSSSNGGFVIHHPHTNSNYQPQEEANSLIEEANSLINFKSGYDSFMHMHSGGSLLSFQQEDNHINFPMWEGGSSTSLSSHDHLNLIKNNNNCGSNLHLMEEVNCLQSATDGGAGGGAGYQDEANEWLYMEAIGDPPQESRTQQTCFNKRTHHMDEEIMQASKKQCTNGASKKLAKPKPSTSKDPQSIAAKNRRERISERLKILQDLVPNGSKVDLVTMLEKAIGYVKFLQLQVKVLATDEFWPAAGGKAPDISQVREAIDTILSTQRSSEGPEQQV